MNLNSSSDAVEQSPKPRRSSTTKRVLLLGASGFIGSRILRALRTQSDNPVSILSRRHDSAVVSCDNHVIRGDVTIPSTLSAALDGVDVVINAVSYVGHDPHLARAVNLEGARNILRACEKSAVSNVIHVGTTAVYGSGPHRGLHAWEIDHRPESVASLNRALAEQAVLASGGVVVRPNLVYGIGDVWVVPGIIGLFTSLRATIEAGSALVSVIDVDDLGRLVATLATSPVQTSGVLHAAYSSPVHVKELLSVVSEQVQELPLLRDRSLPEALHSLATSGFRPHQIRMVGADHYYASDEIWHLTGQQENRFRLSPEAAVWYREHLGM